MTGYRLTPAAEADLESIGDYIATDNPTRALTFVQELRARCRHIATQPRVYRRRDDLAPGLRQAIHGRYLILFTLTSEDVVIERIVHGARRLEDLV